MARKVAVMNQKGGVAKTTTAVNLAVCLAAQGRRVLLVDCDPQGNASQFLGLTHTFDDASLYGSAELILGRREFAPVRGVLLPSLDVVPATDELTYVEHELLMDPLAGQVQALASAVRAVEADYDFVIADCPPTLGMLALNAIVACPDVLVPVRLSGASVAGALRLRANTIDRIRQRAAPTARLLGVLGTFYSESARSPAEVLARMREAFGNVVFDTVIHQSQAVDDSSSLGRPIVLRDASSRGAKEYVALTQEVLNRG